MVKRLIALTGKERNALHGLFQQNYADLQALSIHCELSFGQSLPQSSDHEQHKAKYLTRKPIF